VAAGIAPVKVDVELARIIDHTLLKPDATIHDITRLCAEGREYGFASVCVNSAFVSICAPLLRGSEVRVCATIGFPLGAASSAAKAAETEQAIRDGANEVDMVINVGLLKSGRYDDVADDIRSVTNIARTGSALSKVILETGLLTDREKMKACLLAMEAGADFVKTSTGFGKGGATTQDIALMRRAVGSALGVEASGGIRTREDGLAMVASGANRIGASASIAVVTAGVQQPLKGT